jgi:dihydroflavonol-4-reductase
VVKALVTGGTGFVGSHIARLLTEDGHSVRVLHRATSRLDALAGVDYEPVIGDILDTASLRTACAGCDWVFHVAAVVDYWRADQTRMMEANVEGTRRVLEAAQEVGVRRVVFTSSAAAVGLSADGTPADESLKFNLPPERFPYGHSKALAEQVVQDSVAHGQEAVIMNPVAVMGPGDLNLISGSFITMVKRLQWTIPVTSGGVAVTDVRDVARWHIAAAQHGRSGERYLLGTANYSYKEWYAMIADIVGVAKPRISMPGFLLPAVAASIDVARRAGIPTLVDANQARLGARNVFFDSSKTWRELGEPKFDMCRSLRDTYDWYLEHGYIHESRVELVLRRMGYLIGARPRRSIC